jgi:8-oxo-dGTP diphosphatase
VAERADIQLTVDIAIFTVRDETLQVLLIQRAIPPFQGAWAIPGGFVNRGETLDAAARRELSEETGAEDVYLEQLYTFGDPRRDPRGRVVTVAYYALVPPDRLTVRPGSDAADARLFSVHELPDLAFDHAAILDRALARIRGKVGYSSVGFELLPEKFTLSELQRVFEQILGRSLDKRNFRRKVKLLDVLVALEEWERGEPNRPARLYSFSRERFQGLEDEGPLFPF